MLPTIECDICGKKFKKLGIATHIWRVHGEGKNHKKVGFRGIPSWNKGLTKETDDRVKKSGEKLRNKILSGEITPGWKGRKHSKETLEKLSKNSGGYRKGSGKGKKGIYDGIHFDSTWELAWYIYNKDLGVKFKRCDFYFEYIYKGKQRKYYPDFVLDDNKTLIEIKGFLRNKDEFKFKSVTNNYQLNVLSKEEIFTMIEYSKNKYNINNLYELYDDHIKEIKFNKQDLVNKERINKILESKIDFSKNGWITKLSKEIKYGRNGIIPFMLKYLPDFYEKCNKRNIAS